MFIFVWKSKYNHIFWKVKTITYNLIYSLKHLIQRLKHHILRDIHTWQKYCFQILLNYSTLRFDRFGSPTRNVDHIGLTVWSLNWFELLCASRGIECKVIIFTRHDHIASKYWIRKVARPDLVEGGNSARRKLAVCRFKSHLESSHLLVTPASWPTYRDRHITNVTLYNRMCTCMHRYVCVTYICVCHTIPISCDCFVI